jgi:hypothetical protein
VDPPLPAGMMLPSKTKTGSMERSSGRQKPFAGQWKPGLAIKPRLFPEMFRRVLIFFTACSQINTRKNDRPNFPVMKSILGSGASGR